MKTRYYKITRPKTEYRNLHADFKFETYPSIDKDGDIWTDKYIYYSECPCNHGTLNNCEEVLDPNEIKRIKIIIKLQNL